MQKPFELSILLSLLVFALAPLTLVISHPSVSLVVLPCAIAAIASAGQLRATVAASLRPLPVAAGIVGVLGLVSATWAMDKQLALSKAAVFLLVILSTTLLAALLTRSDREARDRISGILVKAFLAAMLLLGVQIYGGFLLKDYFLDANYDAATAAIKLNVSSAGMVILVWAALCGLLRRIQRRFVQAIVGGATLIALAMIVFAGTGLAPKVALLLGMAAWGVGRLWPRAACAALAVGIGAISVSLLFVPSQVYRSEGFAELRWLDSSAKYRVDIWDNAAQWVRQKPVLGYGAGASEVLPPRAELSKVTGQPRSIPMYPHNVLVQTMLELGIAGLLCAWAFFGALLRSVVRLGPGTRPYALAAFTSALTVWLIGYPLWRSAWLAWLGVCALAFVVVERPAVASDGSRI